MTEHLTHHIFEFDMGHGKKIIRELDVPFTEDEITKLQTAYETRNGWSKRAMEGSGLIRDLYANLIDVPWGTALLHRENVLSGIRKTVGNIREVREKRSNSDDYITVAADLSQIESELVSFVPDIEVK